MLYIWTKTELFGCEGEGLSHIMGNGVRYGRLRVYEFDKDHSSSGETRYRGTFSWNDKYLFIVYTMRCDVIRIISARLATKSENEMYYESRFQKG